ncbi:MULTISPECIES: class I SAM-dependent methyltransferase [unclassified Leptotrichia]|uniref:class I SAM-dependent methyltransferase n=1 Tax=unclassified Leptotrichia TaxID=2633022 RepID=UPI0003AD78B8|nr:MULTISPECIES: methyltransferase [unclassified Leptotrichia]ERL27177.1 methyltransferase small domain protein [Leptotrichia sp. oral taxon 225 str. F0581]WLD74689.1 methyltransferase [Leptotrichia sp. HMT-225]
MNHYFSEKQEVKSDRKIIKYEIENKKFEFVTDNGVFSKTKVDFGTDVMLKVFLRENVDRKNQKFDVLDIGCGYGVVSVVMKSFFQKIKTVSSDVNERALELTRENLLKNEVVKAKDNELENDDFEVRKSFAFDNISEKFDVILSNPPIRAGKQTIFQIYEKSFEHLNENGEFYCVIQTKHGAKSTQKKLEEVFGNCETLEINAGYRIFRSVRK